jgi:hypothetical protein
LITVYAQQAYTTVLTGYSWLCAGSAQTIRALLLANATAARFLPRRAMSALSHGLRLSHFVSTQRSVARAVDEPCTEIEIASCADPEEPWLAARRVFPRDQAKPGCQLAAVLGLGHVTDRGDERGGTHRSDPWDGLQPLTFGMGLTDHG